MRQRKGPRSVFHKTEDELEKAIALGLFNSEIMKKFPSVTYEQVLDARLKLEIINAANTRK